MVEFSIYESTDDMGLHTEILWSGDGVCCAPHRIYIQHTSLHGVATALFQQANLTAMLT